MLLSDQYEHCLVRPVWTFFVFNVWTSNLSENKCFWSQTFHRLRRKHLYITYQHWIRLKSKQNALDLIKQWFDFESQKPNINPSDLESVIKLIKCMQWFRSVYLPETNSTRFYNQTSLKQTRLNQTMNFSKKIQKISQIDQIKRFDLMKSMLWISFQLWYQL